MLSIPRTPSPFLILLPLSVLFGTIGPRSAEAQQAPYQAQDPVVTVIPSQILGAPPVEITDPNQKAVVLDLEKHYLLRDIPTKEQPTHARELIDSVLAQIKAQPGDLKTLLQPKGGCNLGPGLLVHLAIWHVQPASLGDGKTPRTFALIPKDSEWHGFQWKNTKPPVGGKSGTGCDLVQAERQDGSPSFLGTNSIYFFAINAFDAQMYGSRVTVDYKLSEIPLLPANLLNLATAISALTGVQLATPSAAANNASAPTPLDNGTNPVSLLSPSTVMVNISQAIIPETPTPVSPLRLTSDAPFTLNASFFLQFQPSPLLVAQGQKLGPADQPSGSAPGTQSQNVGGSGQNDTTIRLKDHLEQLLGNSTAMDLLPLPPGLTFKSDLEAALDNFQASIPGLKPGNPIILSDLPTPKAREHYAALTAAIAAEKYEENALVASAQASQTIQILKNLKELVDRRIQENQPLRLEPGFPTQTTLLRNDNPLDMAAACAKNPTGTAGFTFQGSTLYCLLAKVRVEAGNAAERFRQEVEDTQIAVNVIAILSDADRQAAETKLDQAEKNLKKRIDAVDRDGRAKIDDQKARDAAIAAVTQVKSEIDVVNDAIDKADSALGDLEAKIDLLTSQLPNPATQPTAPVPPSTDPNTPAQPETPAQPVECTRDELSPQPPRNADEANAPRRIDCLKQAIRKEDVKRDAANLDIAAKVDHLKYEQNLLEIDAGIQAAAEAKLTKDLQSQKEDEESEKSAQAEESQAKAALNQEKARSINDESVSVYVEKTRKITDLAAADSMAVDVSLAHAVQDTQMVLTSLAEAQNLVAPNPIEVNTLKNPIDVETFIKERKLPNWTPDYKGKKIVDIPKTMESVQKYLQSIGDLAEVLRNEVTSTVGAEKDASDTDATAAKAEEDSDSKKQPVPGCQQNCCCQNGNAGAAEATAKPATSSRKDPPDHGGSITGVPFRAGDFPLLLVVHSDPSSLASDPDYAACVPPAAASPDPDANPCVQFVSLTSSAATSGGASGGGGGGGSGHGGGQGGGGNNQGGNNQGGGNQGGGNQGGGNAAVSPSQPVDCSRQSSASGPCAFSRVFTVDEAEWWDVSLGLATPGPKEATYTFSTSSMAPKATPGCPLGYTCGFKHHADAYILFDFYPFAKTWGHGSHAFAAHDSPAPHVNFGIPITSQSLYRPYWGVAENLTWYAERHWKFPLSVSFYSGLTWMKQSLCESSCVASTTAIQPIPQDRALKGTYGFEVSISAIAGKLKGGGSSKSGGSGGSSKTGGN